MLSLLTRTKSFRDPWVGHPDLNRRWQLHRRRVQLAETLCLWRRLLRPAQLASLERDGFVVLENFLPQPDFEVLRDEVEAVVIVASITVKVDPELAGRNFERIFGRRKVLA